MSGITLKKKFIKLNILFKTRRRCKPSVVLLITRMLFGRFFFHIVPIESENISS